MSKLGTYANKLYLISEKIRRGCCCDGSDFDPGVCCGQDCEWNSFTDLWNLDFCGTCDGPFVRTRSVLALGLPEERNYVQTSAGFQSLFDDGVASDQSPFGGGDVGSGITGEPCAAVGSANNPFVDGTTKYRWTSFDFSAVLAPIFSITFVNELGSPETFFSQVCPGIFIARLEEHTLGVSWLFDSYNSSRDTAYLFGFSAAILTAVDVEPEVELPFPGPWQFRHNGEGASPEIQIRIHRDWALNGGGVSADNRCPDRSNPPSGGDRFDYRWDASYLPPDSAFQIPITIPADDTGWHLSPDQPNGDTTVAPITSWQPTWRNATDEDCSHTCIYGLA